MKFLKKVKFWGLFPAYHPQNWNFVQKKLRVGYVYIEESFDTIFDMGYGGGAYRTPPPCLMRRENHPCF